MPDFAPATVPPTSAPRPGPWVSQSRYARAAAAGETQKVMRPTTEDHVAPWKSVYKLHLLADADVTFLLTNGGHNAVVVSEPGHPRRRYQVTTHSEGERYVDADTWPEWQRWLVARSAPEPLSPTALGAPEQGLAVLGPAPGACVFQD